MSPGCKRGSAHETASWLSFPLMMTVYIGAAIYCLHQGYDPKIWVISLSIANFFTLLGLEIVLPKNPATHLFRDPQLPNDILFNTINGLARPTFGAGAAMIAAALSQFRLSSTLVTLWPSRWPFAIQFVLAILVSSFGDYWLHRMNHTIDRLWWFHALHHSSRQMHVFKGARSHIIEEIPYAFFTPLPLLLLGAPKEIILMNSMWVVYIGNILHSNVDQRVPSWAHYFIPTVDLHHLHHSDQREYQDSNYASTAPIFDLIFGTFRHPDRCKYDKMGIREGYVSDHVVKQFFQPFFWQLKPPPSASSGSTDLFK